MPLIDVECVAGHRSEMIKRGAVTGPLSCPDCGGEAKRVYSTFAIETREVKYAPPEPFPPKTRPKFIDRMGGGKAALTEDHLYRPAVTHNTRCPKEGKWRNVAVLNDLKFAIRLCCEGCGYTWLYRGETAADPLFNTVVESYRPGRNFSSAAPAGTGYTPPERGA